MMHWVLSNLIPILGLIASLFVLFKQHKLQKQLTKDHLKYSHRHKMLGEAIHEINDSMMRAQMAMGAMLMNSENLKMFLSYHDETRTECIAFQKACAKYELYLTKEMLECAERVAERFGHHLQQLAEIVTKMKARETSDLPNQIKQQESEFLGATRQALLDLSFCFRKWLETFEPY